MIDVAGLKKTTRIQAGHVLSTFLQLVDMETTSAALEGQHNIVMDIAKGQAAMAKSYLTDLGFTVFITDQGQLHILWL